MAGDGADQEVKSVTVPVPRRATPHQAGPGLAGKLQGPGRRQREGEMRTRTFIYCSFPGRKGEAGQAGLGWAGLSNLADSGTRGSTWPGG